MKHESWLILLALTISCYGSARAQTTPQSVRPSLEMEVQPAPVTASQVQQFLAQRIPKQASPRTAQNWTAGEARLRARILNDVVYHGWPRQWIDAPPNFEEVGVIETGQGYRLRKFRWEIVPGFWSTALLYEPAHIHGKVPAILSVVGHFRWGKAEEWVQKRCINFAKRGILTLSLEWIGYGELFVPEDSHNDFGPHLNLAGVNTLGLFYFAMRRGLDYLHGLPDVDPKRIGMTGLSGGGWQTVVLGGLDPRVTVAVEVAGLGSLASNIMQPGDTDEAEQNAPDFNEGFDYPDLVAMRAPRPTLLIHNAEDTCCFRAMLVKPYVYDAIKPFFQLFNRPNALAWHENLHPGTHNYQLDNRQRAYQFFMRYFGLPIAAKEIASDEEIRRYEELRIGVPKNNLTILGLARRFAAQVTRAPIPADPSARAQWAHTEREKLRSVIRYEPVKLENAWRTWNTHSMGLETLEYRFDFSNGLSAAGVWLKASAASTSAPATVVLADQGRAATGDLVSDRVDRGEQVLALDLIFNGAMRPQEPNPSAYEFLMDGAGVRPLGLEVAQLIAGVNWLRQASHNPRVRAETRGIRSQVVALTAAAIDPCLFSEVVTHQGLRSLLYLFDAPVSFLKAPELFCLDFYKDFDVNWLVALAQPTNITQVQRVGAMSHH